MANSSDWLGALAEPDGVAADAPEWLGQLGGASAFDDASPFGAPEPEAPPPPLEPEAAEPAPDACARAFADGVAAGRAAAAAEAEALATRQRALRLAFRSFDEAALGVLADDLAATVLHLCDSVLGEAAHDPDALRERCIVAARRIGGAADALVLHLNPDDIALLGDAALVGMRLVPDPTLEPGSLVIEGGEGAISDGPVEWRRAIAAALRA